jgi:dolichol kinase
MRVFCDKSGITVRQYWNTILKELFRKSIHLCTALIPFLLSRFYWIVLGLLFSALVCYCSAEICRLKGRKVPLISAVTEAAARKRDENRFVMGPVTLVLGIIISALLWNEPAAAIGILSLAFGDGLASLAGKLFGQVKLPLTNGKTAAGSLTCFTATFCAVFVYAGNSILALLIAAAAMFIEMLPLKDWDNLFIPVVLGGLAQFLLPKI